MPVPKDQPASAPALRGHWLALAVAAVVVLTAAALRAQGHRWWCACGRPFLVSVDIHSPHNSHHLADPYSLTHVLHGLILYALLRPLARWLGPGARLLAAVALEGLWEVVENSGPVIERYRRATIAQGYSGDSLVNSLGDVVSCALGYVLARRLPVRWSVALFFAVEVGLLWVFRDNLALNVLMLLRPSEAVRAWQQGR